MHLSRSSKTVTLHVEKSNVVSLFGGMVRVCRQALVNEGGRWPRRIICLHASTHACNTCMGALVDGDGDVTQGSRGQG